MNVWLITIGEPLPAGIAAADRPHRTGTLARILAARGHAVTWWTSSFDHFRKVHLFDRDTDFDRRGVHIAALRGCGYRAHVSPARFADHWQVARKFMRRAAAEPAAPDLILSALPTIDLCLEAVRYGRARGVPVVLDMRDMWPDIFAEVAPRPLRPLAQAALAPLYWQARRACAGATAITGITEAFVEWGLRRGRRQRTRFDRAFPLGYTPAAPEPAALEAAARFWDERGVPARDDAVPTACFIGAFGRQLDLDTIVRAARLLAANGTRVRFVLAGAGDRLEAVRQAAAGLDNVILPGWIDAAQGCVLMQRASVGLDPLPERFDFLATVNNKAAEYLGAGLPVLSSPRAGVLAELLERERCGLTFPAGDAAELAAILAALAQGRETLARMSERAAAVFRSRFDGAVVYRAMAEHLEELAVAGRLAHV